MNKNQTYTETFRAGSSPVADKAEIDRLCKAFAEALLAKVRGGSSVAGAVEHNLAVGATEITSSPVNVSPAPFATRAGSDHMLALHVQRSNVDLLRLGECFVAEQLVMG